MKRLKTFMVAAVVFGTLGLGSTRELRATPGTGALFGTDSVDGNLLSINPATGVASVIGPMGVGPVPSLALDPATGVLYAGGGQGTPNIFTVNPSTGAAVLLGDSGLGFASVGALDFNASGTLYAAVNIAGDGGTGSDHLATINKTTGAATIIGPFGPCTGVTVPSTGDGACTIEGIEGIAFDASGTLWGSHSARGAGGAPGLYRINVASGSATFVAPILDASASPPSGGVVSLQFACNGTLYGGTATAVPPALDGGDLVIIDPVTGVFSTVGKAVSAASLGALAFQNVCSVPRIPMLSEWALAALAILLLAHVALTLRKKGSI